MKIDFDPDQIQDLEQRKFCKEAIEILANSESAIMAEARLRSSTTEGQVDYLRELMASRKADLRNFPERYPQPTCYDTVELSDFVGIQEARLNEHTATWICKLSINWLETKINEMREPSNLAPSNEDSNSAPSTPFQVLVIHYLLKHAEYEMNGKQKAKLIQAITGKNYKNIYDAVLKPITTLDGNPRTADIIKARELFESVGLGDIAKIISSDLQ